MKRFFFFFCLCFACTTLPAQDVVHHQRGEDLQQYLLDSVKFVNPDFKSGMVVFKDGTFSRGPLNISTIEQCVYFINPSGDIQVLANEDQVKRVSIGNRSFVKSKYGYVELLQVEGEVALGVVRRVSFFETEKKGAYGSKSQTTSVTTIGTLTTAGVTYTLGVDQDTPFKYKTIPYLYLYGTNRVLLSNKKNFLKCFPDKKDRIEAFVKANSVDFEKYEDAAALFEALKD